MNLEILCVVASLLFAVMVVVWKFVAVGIGHDIPSCTGFLRSLADVDPDMAVNIEHEGVNYSRLDGLTIAAENLRAAAKM